MRSAGTAVVLGCWLLLIRQRIVIPSELRLKALAVGLLVSAQSFFLYSAVQRMPVALALLVFNLFPMMLGFLSWGLGGDRPSRRAWIGMPIALGGLMWYSTHPQGAWSWHPGTIDFWLASVLRWPRG